jgi:uncharacterized caspase-like protein
MPHARAYAVLIGVNENEVSRWALPEVEQDVEALRAVLVDVNRCAYPPDQVRVVRGRDATRSGILNAIGWLTRQIAADRGGDSTALLYYSGHGLRDRDADPPAHYLIPYDVSDEALDRRALSAADFADAVAALTAGRVLVVMDCCHAGGMGAKDVTRSTDRFAPGALPPDILLLDDDQTGARASKGGPVGETGGKRAVLASSRGDQISYLRRDGTMSIFTYHLIEALTGHAQTEPGATEVLVSDVMGHVSRRVPRSAWTDWRKDQEPDVRMTGNFPVARLLGGKGLARGQSPPDPLTSPAAGWEPRRGHSTEGDTITIHGSITNSQGIAIGRGARAAVVKQAPRAKRGRR